MISTAAVSYNQYNHKYAYPSKNETGIIFNIIAGIYNIVTISSWMLNTKLKFQRWNTLIVYMVEMYLTWYDFDIQLYIIRYKCNDKIAKGNQVNVWNCLIGLLHFLLVVNPTGTHLITLLSCMQHIRYEMRHDTHQFYTKTLH